MPQTILSTVLVLYSTVTLFLAPRKSQHHSLLGRYSSTQYEDVPRTVLVQNIFVLYVVFVRQFGKIRTAVRFAHQLAGFVVRVTTT